MSQSTMSAQDYPVPAVSTMNALNENFTDLLNTGTEALLPVFQEKLSDLSGVIRSTERFLFEQVLAGLVLLGNNEWARYDELLEEARLLPDADDAQREALVRHREKDLEQDAQRDFQRLEISGREIAEKLRALGACKLPSVSQRTSDLTEQCDGLKAQLAVQNQHVEKLDGQIADMTVVINAFEAPGLTKIFKGLIPTEQDIDLVMKTLASNALSVDLLRAASQKFTANLAIIMEGRKLSDLIQKRSVLVDERRAISIEKASWEARQATYERELTQLTNVHTLDGLRGQWLQEAQVLSRSWSEQVVLMKRQTSLRELAARLSVMTCYLLAVRRLYEAL